MHPAAAGMLMTFAISQGVRPSNTPYTLAPDASGRSL
jgi:hypothetical protein